jgi:hypothetical protein
MDCRHTVGEVPVHPRVPNASLEVTRSLKHTRVHLSHAGFVLIPVGIISGWLFMFKIPSVQVIGQCIDGKDDEHNFKKHWRAIKSR